MLRFLILPALLATSLGMVYVFPERGRVAESAINIDLPLMLGEWRGVRIPESQQERDILAKDTEFAKAEYRRPRVTGFLGSSSFDRINVSVVLSGYDINNSIHRPERCLPAQGHMIHGKSDTEIKLADGRNLPVRRLQTQQPYLLREGSDEIAVIDSLIYYFFVGHEHLTNDHYERTFIDMKDRLLHGRDQRWAYVTVATTVGEVPWSPHSNSREEAEKMLSAFCAQFAAETVDWDATAE